MMIGAALAILLLAAFPAHAQGNRDLEESRRRLEEIRARWDPDARFASYLTADREGLNVHE